MVIIEDPNQPARPRRSTDSSSRSRSRNGGGGPFDPNQPLPPSDYNSSTLPRRSSRRNATQSGRY